MFELKHDVVFMIKFEMKHVIFVIMILALDEPQSYILTFTPTLKRGCGGVGYMPPYNIYNERLTCPLAYVPQTFGHDCRLLAIYCILRFKLLSISLVSRS